LFENQKVDIDKQLWKSILKDPKIINEKVLSILRYMYSRPRFESSGKTIALALGYSHHAPLNNIIPKFSRRILEKYHAVTIPERDDGTKRLWHIPFLGSYQSDSFNWILRPELVDALEEVFGIKDDEEVFSEEFDQDEILQLEGKVVTVSVNKYERSRKARKICIDANGYECAVCGFDFEKQYGPIGKGKIQVHHKRLISEYKTEYVLDAINDLVPICANCHMIIHSKKIPFTIEEVKEIMKNSLTLIST
jgi:5-methylcytosine-specific restriction protein A